MVSKIGGSVLTKVVDALCEEESYQTVYHMPEHDRPMPSIAALGEFVERLRAVIFPGYFGDSEIRPETMRYHIGGNLDAAYRILEEQILRGHCFSARPMNSTVPTVRPMPSALPRNSWKSCRKFAVCSLLTCRLPTWVTLRPRVRARQFFATPASSP